jgi:hypothetical protein
LIYGNDKIWGYVRLTIDNKSIKGQSTEIDRAGNVTLGADKFQYPAGPMQLKNPKSVPTL